MRRAWLAVLLMSAGCVLKFGPRPQDFEPANVASGVRASMALSESSIEGELLEMRSNSVLLLTKDRVVQVPFDAITASVFTSTRVTIGNRRPPAFEDQRTLQMLSRYPQGIPPAALQKLLQSKGQAEPVVLK